jgi:hypothetical protein
VRVWTRDRVWLIGQRVLLALVVLTMGVALRPLYTHRAAAYPAPAGTDALPDGDLRLRLTQAQQAALASRSDEAALALGSFMVGCPRSDPGGSLPQAWYQCLPGPRSPTPTMVEAALSRAGFTAIQARLAQLGDPAPLGTIVFGARAGAGCVLGYTDGARGGVWVAAPRVAGGCIRPV